MLRIILAVLCICALLLCCYPAKAEDLVALAKQIIQANRDYEGSVVSLAVTYTVQPLLTDHQPDPKRQSLDWTWAKSGQREVVFTNPAFVGYGLSIARLWSAFDGSDGIDVAFWAFDSQLAARMQMVHRDTSSVAKLAVPAGSLGWTVPHCESLVAMLEQANSNELLRESTKYMVGPNKFVERPAVKWVLKRFQLRETFPEHTVIAYFDPAHDWLPCQIEIIPTMLLTAVLPPKELPEGTTLYAMVVEKYIEAEDPVVGRPRYFPGTIRVYGSPPSLITTNSVRFNAGVEESMFSPPVSPGTLIVKNAGSRNEQREFVGRDGEELHSLAGQKEEEFRANPIAAQKSPAALKPRAVLGDIDATPPASSSILSTLITAGSILVLIFVVIRRQRA